MIACDYCLHNQLKFHNLIELLPKGFIIQLRLLIFKTGIHKTDGKLTVVYSKKSYCKM